MRNSEKMHVIFLTRDIVRFICSKFFKMILLLFKKQFYFILQNK